MCLKGPVTAVTCCFACMVCGRPSAEVPFPLYLILILSNAFWDLWQIGKAEDDIKLYPPQSLHRDCARHGLIIYAFTRLHKLKGVGLDQHQTKGKP